MVKTKPYINFIIILTLVIVGVNFTITTDAHSKENLVKNSKTLCSDVALIGARGSGGVQTGDRDDNYTGVSGPVYGVYKKLETQLGKENKTISLHATQYPAVSLQTGFNNPKLFIDSIKKGADNMNMQAAGIAKSCPKTKIILAGFSQGAMVVHEASINPIRNIVGLLLIANGYRSVGDKTIFKGTGSPLNQGLAHGLIPTPKPLNGNPASVTVCVIKDIVCDQTGSLSGESVNIHSTGYLNNKIQNQQARALVKILKNS